jgi:hypothetical protein
MDELLDMIAADGPAFQISDKIKEILFTKSAEKIDTLKPTVASSLFGNNEGNEEE